MSKTAMDALAREMGGVVFFTDEYGVAIASDDSGRWRRYSAEKLRRLAALALKAADELDAQTPEVVP